MYFSVRAGEAIWTLRESGTKSSTEDKYNNKVFSLVEKEHQSQMFFQMSPIISV